MAKNKYDFIKELLEDKRIKQNQRERILELASKEISLEGTLEERVKKIEEMLFKKEGELILTKESDYFGNIDKLVTEEEEVESVETVINTNVEENNLPKYLNPIYLYNFLFLYNQNKILRTTCHDIDSDELESILEFCKIEKYDFKKHLNRIHDAYANHEKINKAPHQVKALIRGYLTGKDYYGKISEGWSNNIKINWNSEELSNWVNLNIETPPNLNEEIAGSKEIELLEFTQIKNAITAIPIQNFTQLVLHFKNLFHIKSGPQSLREIIKRVNSEKNWNEKVDIEFDELLFINNLEHFTDVEKLIQAYNKLVKLIIEKHQLMEKPKVILRYYQENQKVIFSIHHFNGIYDKTIENTIERKAGQTYTSLIKKQINGLCNLHLKADFGRQQFAEINLWNGEDRESKPITAFQGVEHILEFPKIEKL
jgi:hypothetical protein